MSLQTMIFRMMCKRSDDARDRGLTVPDGVECFCNIRYGKDKKYGLLDVYRPKNTAGAVPVIVNFHGGGWIYGTKETYRFYCMSLAEQGFAVVDPSYRLAPKHRFPAAFEDINDVFRFVLDNAGKYGFDTAAVFGLGDSSGAAGMAAYAAVLTCPGLAEEFPVTPPEGLKLRGLGLNCGTYTAKGRADFYINTLPKNDPEKVLELLHTVDHITADYPPCFLMTAADDFMKDQQAPMEEALRAKGVRFVSKLYGDESNRLGHVFHCNIRDKNAAEANKEQLEFFRSCIE
ncbi:alpha/beta hydrolase [Ruminococcus flavefaciens]|uniref:alpha/beta hydrolase n=1 Tax=Ruminococcus flavefaciens TaxID=1265 RepID=UPI0006858761|nr:alpha/beta hydrolase [Ruminococcus flavefaciens]